MTRQGPHHGAQKSTTTGVFCGLDLGRERGIGDLDHGRCQRFLLGLETVGISIAMRQTGRVQAWIVTLVPT